jgi:beta-galactosidase
MDFLTRNRRPPLRALFLCTVLLTANWTAQAAVAPAATPPAHRFEIGQTDFLLDGQRLQIRCGEIHFARVPREYWSHRLKAIKAMGLNTVCAYLFWNYHEWNEGTFDWQGQRDAAEFCRLAQQEGLWVILRPGPYACAEWEMGGLPWWLLKNPGDNFLRTRDPHFVEPARRWLTEVGRVLGPLQITRGGPILMVQVENEYGFFGRDADYMRTMRQAMLDAGFDVPLFACNPTNALARSHLPELFSVANFGSNPEAGFKALAEVQKGPLMCGEFYPGWFDTWGAPHHRGNTPVVLRDLDYMLKANGSFSLYMAHGGTTFGLWAGCDRPFKPDTSSYDYDAPISEAGLVGEKFNQFREVLKPYLLPGETLPEPPEPMPIIAIPPFKLTGYMPVSSVLPDLARAKDISPRSIEAYDISRGLISYRSTLPAGSAGTLEATLVRDLAWVYLDGQLAGMMDTRSRRFRVNLPARTKPAKLEVLVYTISRVNFGIEIHDRKGLHGPIQFLPKDGAPQPVENWEIHAIDFGADAELPNIPGWLPVGTNTVIGPTFWHGVFQESRTGDTFLDVSKWGTGIVWINGHCLGRFWNIGPTQTMYVPAPWLKCGRNEVVVLDLAGPEEPVLAGLKEPILDHLRPEKDFFPRNNRGQLQLTGLKPVHEAVFATGPATQEIRFAKATEGRQFCLESIDAFDGKDFAAVGEIELLDGNGKVMNQSPWTIAYADSEESTREDGSALNAINGQASDHWHTEWSGKPPRPAHPHRIVIDLGATARVSGFRYTPRQGDTSATGRIKTYRIYVGERLIAAPN